YLRETFFHIPFLLADHLNSQQKFAQAQHWYHTIFDPTAADGLAWRYREFRGADKATSPSLRTTLSDPAALAAYRAAPFNPHAIARLRPGAYRKAIVMKYIDNLLDWGDSLFGQFTMESVNEASMLYVMAADILGPRPAQLGQCGARAATPKTYQDLAPLMRPGDPNATTGADFLIEQLEDFTRVAQPAIAVPYVVQSIAAPVMSQGATGHDPVAAPLAFKPLGAQMWKEVTASPLAALYGGDPAEPPAPGPSWSGNKYARRDAPPGFRRDVHLLDVVHGKRDIALPDRLPPKRIIPEVKPFELVQARLLFCIPENKELNGYWERVQDRLNKIRNCMDIAGVRRRLDLFAPEIDPRMLVRMRAAGLSLEDVMNATSGSLPPYRFTYLIEKAKQHAALVQQFGSQLQGALERRDGEELTRLRTAHEQNLLQLRTHMTTWEIDAAEDLLEGLQRQKSAARYRQSHFRQLGEAGLLASETKQQQLLRDASAVRTQAGLAQMIASVLTIIPDVGAFTAMKFGGSQLGAAGRAVAEGLNAVAACQEAGASMAGIESGNQRREQDWQYQEAVAQREAEQLDKQIAAAEIRRDIAIESRKLHDKSIEQVQEVYDFMRERFTSLGRFTWLSAQLQKLHRGAFNAALGMARLAEQAYRFERPQEAGSAGLSGNYWDAGNAGLLAGERLTSDLHALERRYIETNFRTLEIEQSFSLARCNPDALSRLKTEAACEFEIPEWFFDLTYPGHYRRRIKAVRLTMPCVVGPHTNVGATLRLTGSHLRTEARLASRVPVPLRHMSAIAASMGQSDAGVFEFSFRDERYMPFEGAGASSQWQLNLPATVKPFDYATISDVILRISYTAEEDSELRKAAEAEQGVLATLAAEGIVRIFSMRTDFPATWHQLRQGIAQVEIDLREHHIPFFMAAFELAPASFDLLQDQLETPDYPQFSFHGQAMS
ncbi:MAG: hypothetical protein WKG03_15785, partial [Telluria sp.]